MNESELLEKVLKLCEESYDKGYRYLLKERKKLPGGGSGQVVYFLLCLSAGDGKTEQAMEYVREAESRKLWFRKEALEDGDLEELSGIPEYEAFLRHSAEREAEAFSRSATVCTFQRKRKDRLLLCLHGNGETAESAISDWKAVLGDPEGWQIEGIQSGRPHDNDTFRWEDNDEDYRQLEKVLGKLPLTDFEKVVLCGFPAGCNMILECMDRSKVKCDGIVLQSPWIPYAMRDPGVFARGFAREYKGIRIRIACGTGDEDCFGSAEEFAARMQDAGTDTVFLRQNGNMHCFPQAADDILGIRKEFTRL